MADDDVIYENTLDDGKFVVKVVRTDDYKGELKIWESSEDEPLLTQEVGLAYAAMFGPDVEDVASWQDQAVKTADQWYRDHGQEPPQ